MFVLSNVKDDVSFYSSVEKKPRSAPPSQSTRLEIELVMMREHRMHLFLARTNEMANLVQTKLTVLLSGSGPRLDKIGYLQRRREPACECEMGTTKAQHVQEFSSCAMHQSIALAFL